MYTTHYPGTSSHNLMFFLFHKSLKITKCNFPSLLSNRWMQFVISLQLPFKGCEPLYTNNVDSEVVFVMLWLVCALCIYLCAGNELLLAHALSHSDLQENLKPFCFVGLTVMCFLILRCTSWLLGMTKNHDGLKNK